MNSSRKILFVYSHLQSFVREDFDILSQYFVVNKCQFRLEKNILKFFFYQIIGAIRLFFQVWKTDVVYVWFCDYHAFWAVLWAKLFRKKSVIQSGGFDAVSIPEMEYGIFYRNNFGTRLAKWAYKNCDRIVVVDESLIKGENTYAQKGAITGIAYFVKGIEGKSVVIPTGYDGEKWKSATDKKQQVLTTALIKNERVFTGKGIDLFLEVAQRLKDIDFIIVGLQSEKLIPTHLQELSNVKIFPILPQDKLIQHFGESKVYCQFSLSEGLPNVLCEAMMSECVPVGSNVNGIPKAIGDTGFVLYEKDIEKAVELVKQALNTSPEQGKKTRKRILKLFPKEKRAKTLRNLIESL